MRCIVTAGPTWEPIDRVRRLTNFSTGSLGGDLANALAGAGHDVLLFLSETATWHSPMAAVRVELFSTTDSLADRLHRHATPDRIAVFHAAAVSDYRPGPVFLREVDGTLNPLSAGKVDSRAGSLLVELVATPKILPQLRNWFPDARITGWKYEVDGTAEDALDRGRRQLASASTDACVVNGPACGTGFTLLRRDLPAVLLDSRAQLIHTLVSGT
jgi:phosphopantothenoylcysteine synthetase/decarboxylase